MEIWKIMIETIKLELSRLTLRWTGFNPRGWESQDETLSDESNSNVLADSITYNGSLRSFTSSAHSAYFREYLNGWTLNKHTGKTIQQTLVCMDKSE